jgi:hypothetical protein
MNTILDPNEIARFMTLWNFHRTDCKHNGDVVIEQRGCAIGTAAIVICGCGKELDITDYASW